MWFKDTRGNPAKGGPGQRITGCRDGTNGEEVGLTGVALGRGRGALNFD